MKIESKSNQIGVVTLGNDLFPLGRRRVDENHHRANENLLQKVYQDLISEDMKIESKSNQVGVVTLGNDLFPLGRRRVDENHHRANVERRFDSIQGVVLFKEL
ncbi:hypothetical protein CDAR_40711 [Caerostris darwini]|uniref:Uncharacterized protein n=1 Tax=Caerostris darwini TaxID=1538125 RepID=A0AAV4TCE5_9ARAC|nr:hypothetical protein CDAR_40711 [Caerostris darwini]